MGMTICPSKFPKLSQDKSLNSIFKTPLNKHLSASDQHPSDQPPLSQKVGSLDKSGLPEKVREYPIASIKGLPLGQSIYMLAHTPRDDSQMSCAALKGSLLLPIFRRPPPSRRSEAGII
jgi:hypothetical protein